MRYQLRTLIVVHTALSVGVMLLFSLMLFGLPQYHAQAQYGYSQSGYYSGAESAGTGSSYGVSSYTQSGYSKYGQSSYYSQGSYANADPVGSGPGSFGNLQNLNNSGNSSNNGNNNNGGNNNGGSQYGYAQSAPVNTCTGLCALAQSVGQAVSSGAKAVADTAGKIVAFINPPAVPSPYTTLPTAVQPNTNSSYGYAQSPSVPAQSTYASSQVPSQVASQVGQGATGGAQSVPAVYTQQQQQILADAQKSFGCDPQNSACANSILLATQGMTPAEAHTALQKVVDQTGGDLTNASINLAFGKNCGDKDCQAAQELRDLAAQGQPSAYSYAQGSTLSTSAGFQVALTAQMKAVDDKKKAAEVAGNAAFTQTPSPSCSDGNGNSKPCPTGQTAEVDPNAVANPAVKSDAGSSNGVHVISVNPDGTPVGVPDNAINNPALSAQPNGGLTTRIVKTVLIDPTTGLPIPADSTQLTQTANTQPDLASAPEKKAAQMALDAAQKTASQAATDLAQAKQDEAQAMVDRAGANCGIFSGVCSVTSGLTGGDSKVTDAAALVAQKQAAYDAAQAALTDSQNRLAATTPTPVKTTAVTQQTQTQVQQTSAEEQSTQAADAKLIALNNAKVAADAAARQDKIATQKDSDLLAPDSVQKDSNTQQAAQTTPAAPVQSLRDVVFGIMADSITSTAGNMVQSVVNGCLWWCAPSAPTQTAETQNDTVTNTFATLANQPTPDDALTTALNNRVTQQTQTQVQQTSAEEQSTQAADAKLIALNNAKVAADAAARQDKIATQKDSDLLAPSVTPTAQPTVPVGNPYTPTVLSAQQAAQDAHNTAIAIQQQPGATDAQKALSAYQEYQAWQGYMGALDASTIGDPTSASNEAQKAQQAAQENKNSWAVFGQTQTQVQQTSAEEQSTQAADAKLIALNNAKVAADALLKYQTEVQKDADLAPDAASKTFGAQQPSTVGNGSTFMNSVAQESQRIADQQGIDAADAKLIALNNAKVAADAAARQDKIATQKDSDLGFVGTVQKIVQEPATIVPSLKSWFSQCLGLCSSPTVVPQTSVDVTPAVTADLTNKLNDLGVDLKHNPAYVQMVQGLQKNGKTDAQITEIMTTITNGGKDPGALADALAYSMTDGKKTTTPTCTTKACSDAQALSTASGVTLTTYASTLTGQESAASTASCTSWYCVTTQFFTQKIIAPVIQPLIPKPDYTTTQEDLVKLADQQAAQEAADDAQALKDATARAKEIADKAAADLAKQQTTPAVTAPTTPAPAPYDPSEKLAGQEASSILQQNNITTWESKPGATQLEGLRSGTIDAMLDLKNACGCELTVTGAAEKTGNDTRGGEFSHANGYKFDARIIDKDTGKQNELVTYLQKAAADGTLVETTKKDGTKMYYDPTKPNVVYHLQKSNLDVTTAPVGTDLSKSLNTL